MAEWVVLGPVSGHLPDICGKPLKDAALRGQALGRPQPQKTFLGAPDNAKPLQCQSKITHGAHRPNAMTGYRNKGQTQLRDTRTVGEMSAGGVAPWLGCTAAL